MRRAGTKLVNPLAAIGGAGLALLSFIGDIAYLWLDCARQLPRALLARRTRRLGWENLWFQMVRVGVRSIPIVSLVLFCIGAILAFQMAPVLQDFDMVSKVADVISVAVFRELGPLVSGIVLTGFAGASIAAEVGSMVVSEEIEALESHAIDPVRFLAVPRILGTTIMMVCVAVLGDLMGILGGLAIAWGTLGLSGTQYLHDTFAAVRVADFVTGLVKAAFFGAIISSFALRLGLSVTGGAEGVGAATTRTVVYTIVALIFVDLVFTTAFYFLGW